jgi:phosphatidylinositol alpha-1,6-mannosyltransferase
MVAIEAAAHGLPTVAFEAGGVADAVVEGVSGSLVQAENYEAFASQINRWLAIRDQPQTRSKCMAAASVFGWDRFSEKLHIALNNR